MMKRTIFPAVMGAVLALASTATAQERREDAFWSGLAAGALAGAAGGARSVGAAGAAAVAAGAAAGGAARAPRVTPEEVTRALNRGAAYLVGSQGEDGGWSIGSDAWHRSANPNIRSAITAYVVAALRQTPAEGSPAAIRRGESYIDRFGAVSTAAVAGGPGGNTPLLYGLAMGLSNAVSRPQSAERDALANRYIAHITRMLSTGGATGYYGGGSAATFQLAMLAEALREAQAAGLTVSSTVVAGVHRDMESSRGENGYSYYSGGGGASGAHGAAGRSLACEVAALRSGRGSAARLAEAMRRHLAAQGMVAEVVRSTPDHHQPERQNIAPYYQLFGIYWASEALSSLPAQQAGTYAHALGRILVDIQRGDGSWVDSRTFGGPAYGTAAAMLSLRNIAAALQRADRDAARRPASR